MENIRMNLRLFDANTQVTTQQSLTEEMKTFYSDYLIDAAEPELVHDQFAQKHPIPANGGKTIQFRRFAPLGKALTALTEGVTPDGQSLSMTTVEAAVRQYGGYIQMSDLLLLTAIILRCLWVARHASSPMSAYVAMGYGGMLLIQTFVNVASCLYIFPLVGLTLPFFSYGGSSILTLFACMGIVSGVKMRSLPSWLRDRSQL